MPISKLLAINKLKKMRLGICLILGMTWEFFSGGKGLLVIGNY